MDFEENLRKLQAAQGDPEKLTLATVDVVLATHDPGLRAALEAAAIPHWFDTRILSLLLEADETTASKWAGELQGLPMVEAFAARNGWNVHEATRLALRKHLRNTEAELFHYRSRLAAKCFEDNDPASRVEWIYHRLLAAPQDAADELEKLWKEWNDTGRYEPLQTLGVALSELINTDSLIGLARARALLCFGWIRQGQLTVRKAEEYAREAIDIFRLRSEESGEADAHDQLGGILQRAGNLSGALAEYGLVRQIVTSLAQRDPENASWQRELAVCHNKFGGVLKAHGNLPAALLEYRTSREILQRLTEHDPENTIRQRELAVSHSFVGNVLQAQENFDEALLEYKANREIQERLNKLDPENITSLRELSVSHTNVGDVLQAQGNFAEALLEYEADKEIMERLTERDPENTGWQSDLAGSHNRVGNILQVMAMTEAKLQNEEVAFQETTKQLREVALQEHKAFARIMHQLAERDGENTVWQRDWAVARQCLGFTLESLGRLEESLIEYEAANIIAERLAYHDATNERWQRDVESSRESVQRLRRKLASSAPEASHD